MGKLSGEWGETLSDKVKVAILISMLPRDFQDIVYSLGLKGEALDYGIIRIR